MRTTTRWKRSAGALAAVLFTSGAYGAHPLNTEDTGTQGKGGWQLELNGERNKDEGVTGSQAAAALSYGAGETLDLQFGVPWQDDGATRGAADVFAALKWKFWEREALSAAVRAAVTSPTGEQTGGRPAWTAQLIGQYEGERWILLAHVAYRRNLNDVGERDSLGEISGAVLYKALPDLKLLVDASRSTNPDGQSEQKIRQVVVGAIWSPGKDYDLDIGYRHGNAAAIDRALMAGLTFRW